MMLILESNRKAEEEVTASTSPSVASEYSAPARVLRWLVINFFKVIEGIIRLSMLIFYGIKTIVTLVFRFFWPYTLILWRHK